jgi:hypothetical protein
MLVRPENTMNYGRCHHTTAALVPHPQLCCGVETLANNEQAMRQCYVVKTRKSYD